MFISGSQGAIQFGSQNGVDLTNDKGWRSNEVKVTNWTMTTTAQLLDTTTLGDYDKNSVYGLRTHTGTLRLLYYIDSTTTSTPNNNTASWFINALTRASREKQYAALEQPSSANAIESVPVSLKLYLDERNKGSDASFIMFDANLNNVAYSSNTGELVSVDVAFEATGRIYSSQL